MHLAVDVGDRILDPIVARGRTSLWQKIAPVAMHESAEALAHHGPGIFAGHGEHVLAMYLGLDVSTPQDGVHRLFDELRLPLLDNKDRLLPLAKTDKLGFDKRVRDV